MNEDIEKFAPIKFDPKAYARNREAIDMEFKVAYQRLENEFKSLAARLDAVADQKLRKPSRSSTVSPR